MDAVRERLSKGVGPEGARTLALNRFKLADPNLKVPKNSPVSDATESKVAQLFVEDENMDQIDEYARLQRLKEHERTLKKVQVPCFLPWLDSLLLILL